MVKQYIAETVITDWVSPIVIARNKDGALRFCVVYRRLNTMAIRGSYHIPMMDEFIDSQGEESVFSKLHATAG